MNKSTPLLSRQGAAGLLVLAIFTSGCGTTHVSRTEKQGTAIGTAVGATAGAVIGKQLLGDTGGVIVGAAMGAMIGAAVGQTWAERVEAARKKAQSEEERLAATLNASTRIQSDLVKENKQLTERVTRSQATVKKLLEDYQAKKVAKEKLVEQQKDLEKRRKDAEDARVDLEKAIAMEEAAVAQARKANLAAAATLEQQIVTQRKELTNMQRLEQELVTLTKSLDV